MPARAPGSDADAVHLDVIGMAIAAVTVVGGEHVGVFLAQHVGQPRRGVLDRHGRERARGHAGAGIGAAVGEPQEHHPAHAEDGRRGLGLGPAVPPERVPGTELAPVGLTGFAFRGEHRDHPVPGVGRLGHHAGREQRLVVRMGVEGDQGVGHGQDTGGVMTEGPSEGNVTLARP